MFRYHDVLDWLAQEEPDAEFGRDTHGRSMTRAELRDRSNQVAHALLSEGLRPGDRFAVLAKNWLDYLTIYVAAAKSGTVLIPLNYRLTARELAYILTDAGAKLLIARGEYVPTALALRDEVATLESVIAVNGGDNATVEFDEWLSNQPDAATEFGPYDDVIQMYTSGTTGLPKGVVATHDYLTTVLGFLRLVSEGLSGCRLQVVAPFYHVAGTLTALNCLSAGGSVFVHEEFDPAEVVRVLDEEDIGATFLAPAMIQALLVAVPDVATRSYTSLRRIMYGAAPIPEETLRRAIEVFGCEFGQGFGQTEALTITWMSPADHVRALTTGPIELLRACGRAGPGVTLRIVDAEGVELPPYETGEIIARLPGTMKGYWNNPEATAAVIRDGWSYTGDAGYLDDEGYLYIQDRIKDMVVSGGENVYSAEVEQALFQHPDVADVAVIGIPDDRWGETVHAVIQRRPGTDVTADDLVAFCRERIAGYKCPRSVTFVEVVPRNASGKVLKKDLRAPFWEGRERAVG